MASVEVDLKELLGFRDRLLDDRYREYMLTELAEKMMTMVREVAKVNTPIDTGNLRKSWSTDNLLLTVERAGDVYTVSIENKAYNARGKGEFYASFVEEGYRTTSGRWIPGHWMMRTGEIEAERKAQRMFNAIVKDWWEWVNG